MNRADDVRMPKVRNGPCRQPKRGWILVGGAALAATLAGALAQSGHHVHTATDADGVLDTMERWRFDLVLLDLDAPEIDAVATMKLYRFVALGEPQPPIVAVATAWRAEDVRACRDAGIGACLSPVGAALALAELAAGGHAATKSDGATVLDLTAHPRFRAARPAVASSG